MILRAWGFSINRKDKFFQLHSIERKTLVKRWMHQSLKLFIFFVSAFWALMFKILVSSYNNYL